jgi:uncharacterized protein (DUF433 family)
MTTRHLTMRVGVETYDKLEAESRRQQRSVSAIAKTLLEEGLRMQEHPGIVFRPGPAGRRPALADGPDVWEVARLVQSLDCQGDEAISKAAEWASLTPHQVRTALRYYAEHRDDIDVWIERANSNADQAHVAWLADPANASLRSLLAG